MLSDDTKKLLTWYSEEKRALPWRATTEPYAVLVSEIMLQQTTVAAVIPKYERWMARFPSPQHLAQASLEEVMVYWSGLGYYQRARRLYEAAKAVEKIGSFPKDYASIQMLPGVGPYTAAAVASICMEYPVLAVDTNVIRVLFRYYGLKAPGTDKASLRRLHDATRSVWDWVPPGEFNQALMELGATLCSIRAPQCKRCPLKRGCLARGDQAGPESFPLPTPRKELKLTVGRALVLQSSENSGFLLVKGTPLGLLAELHQPLLMFDEVDDSLSTLVAGELSNRVVERERSCGTISYGISGRRLRLSIYHALADRRMYERIHSVLKRAGHRPVTFHVQGEAQPAVSTLTRKVLQRVLENP